MNEFKKTALPTITIFQPKDIPADFADSEGVWLAQQAVKLLSKDKSGYLLIHADDGVLWGYIKDNQVIVPTSDVVPILRSATIQQCRIFGQSGELFIWRESEGIWRGRLLIENSSDYEIIEEEQILWGNRAKKAVAGFTEIYEDGLGMRQFVPLHVEPEDFGRQNRQRVTLTVCHYMSEDSDGQARIMCSRLKKIALRRFA